MSTSTNPCLSCGQPLPSEAIRCPSCSAPRTTDENASHLGTLSLVLIILGAGVLVVLKLAGVFN